MTFKKKIAIVSNTSWSIYNFRLGLLRRLKGLGFEVLVIAPKDAFSSKLIAEGFRFHPIFLDSYGTNPINELRTLRQLVRIYNNQKIDFIFHYTIKPNIYGSLAAAYCRIPSIAVTTGLGHLFSFKNRFVQFASLLMYRFALKFSKEVWFLNESDRETFVAKSIVPTSKTFLLNSEGVDIKWFNPTIFEVEKIPPRIHFLYAGRIIWEKGIGEFVEAAKYITQKYPNTVFQILGFLDLPNPNVVSIEDIEDWQQQGILEYLGETTDVRPHIAYADCIVFPSYYREGISRILLEAAAMGKPLITTNNIGCREVVEDTYNGFLCEPKNSNDLILKLETFLQLSAQEVKKMGKNSRQKVLTEYDERLIIEEYIKKIDFYLGKQPPLNPLRRRGLANVT